MAVPKKRVSRSKKKSRFARWLHKANVSSLRAVSLAKSRNTKDSTNRFT